MDTNTTTHTLKVSIAGFEISSPRFDTLAEAEADAARFPKYVKVRAQTVSGIDAQWFRTSISGDLAASGVNGGVNETGMKRLLKAVEISTPTIISPHANSFSVTEIEALLLDGTQYETLVESAQIRGRETEAARLAARTS